MDICKIMSFRKSLLTILASSGIFASSVFSDDVDINHDGRIDSKDAFLMSTQWYGDVNSLTSEFVLDLITNWHISLPEDTPTPSETPTLTQTETFTLTPTFSYTNTPSITPTPSETNTETYTLLPTPTQTETPTFTFTLTNTNTFTPTITPTPTPSFTPTFPYPQITTDIEFLSSGLEAIIFNAPQSNLEPGYRRTQVSLAVDSNSKPMMIFHATSDRGMMFVERFNDIWIGDKFDNFGYGSYSSLEFDKDDNPHAVYTSIGTGEALSYATRDEFGWHHKTISKSSDYSIGLENDLVIDASNIVHCSAWKWSNPKSVYLFNIINIDNFSSEKVADADWNTTSIAVDSKNNLHLTYYYSGINHASIENGVLHPSEYVSNGANGVLRIDSNDTLHVAAIRNNRELLHLTKDNEWHEEIIIDASPSSIPSGSAIDLAIHDDKCYICYVSEKDSRRNNLHVATNKNGQWDILDIDENDELIYGNPEISLDPNGNVHLAVLAGDINTRVVKYIHFDPFLFGGEIPTPTSSNTPTITYTPTISQTPTVTDTLTPTPSNSPTPTATSLELGSLIDKFQNLEWIAYSPTNYNPAGDWIKEFVEHSAEKQGIDVHNKSFQSYLKSLSEIKARWPSDVNVLTDLTLLYNNGFRGIVTYGANDGLKNVPRIAREVGFDGVIMGMYDIYDSVETANILSASNEYDALCIGNEGIPNRYSLENLINVADNFRQLTHKPISTSEEEGDYLSSQELREFGDWIYPNIHPYWAGIYDATEGANWTQQQYDIFSNLANGKFVILKEEGYPTQGDLNVNETLQKDYFRELENKPLYFTHFEAYDQYWKGSGVEPNWGFYDRDRNPKEVVSLFE